MPTELTNVINKMINELIEDICDRRGIGVEFETIDEETVKEIKKDWANIIYKNLSNLFTKK